MGSRLVSRLALIVFLSSLAYAQGVRQLRIVRPVDNRGVVRLQGSLNPRARVELDRGPTPAATPMRQVTMVFSQTQAQQAELDRLLREQLEPSSVNYHKWLTPEEFGDRFGLAEQDVNTVTAWLQSQGFTIDEIARSRTWISFSGIAAQFEAAFHTSIHNYVVDGKTHYAPSVEPAIPDAFAGVVTAVSGLDDFRPRPRSRARKVDPKLTSGLSGNHFLAPGDFGTIYNLPDYANGVFQPGNDGTGQRIAIVGQTQLVGSPNGPYSDINTFRSVSNLPPINLQAILTGADPGLSSGDIEEANLDIQWAGAVAPNAAIFFVYSNNALLISLRDIVNRNLAPVISISYGECEAQAPPSDITTVEIYLQQAYTQGQTVTAAAGDVGAADCDGTATNPATVATHGLAVDYPSSSVYVTAMGGTEFTGDDAAVVANGVAAATQYWNSSSDPNDTSASAFSYIPETGWNDTSSVGQNVGTGGGVSQQFAKPSWQIGNGVPADGHRDVPDVSLSSSPDHDGYIICSQGSCETGYRRNSDQTFTIIGGTSAASPTFAGIAALANQKLGGRQGNLNPKIYSLAATSSWAFNDITNGDNKVPCRTGTPDCPNGGTLGYSAASGYDLVTGWGSVDASGFLNALAGQPAQPTFFLSPASRTITVNGAASSVTVAVGAVPRQGMTGTVNFSCSLTGFANGETCAIDPSSSLPGSVNLTITSNSNQSLLGTANGIVAVQAVSGNQTQSLSLPVTINYGDFTLSTTNQLLSIAPGASVSQTVTIASSNGFADTLSLTCGGLPPELTCSMTPASVPLPQNGSVTATLTLTASSSATPGSSGGFEVVVFATNGNRSLLLQFDVTTPDFTLTIASPVVSIPSGQMITDNITVAAVGGFNSDVALTCSVSSSLGTTTCAVSPATVTGGSGTAILTVRGAVLTMDRGAPLPFRHGGMGSYAMLVFALGMVFTAGPQDLPRKQRAWRNFLLGLLVFLVMFGAVSCGGGSGSNGSTTGPTPVSGAVTVTATSGNLTHSVSISVTVH